MTLAYDRPAVPVLRTAEAVVAGGSLAGIACALALARAGRSVVLIEPRTYLGRDITATLRPWLRSDSYPLPDLLQELAKAAGQPVDDGEIALKMDNTKIFLEDVLLQAGVELVYASYPVQVLQADGRITGLVIGNKSGRQALRSPLVIDATETALLARLTGAAFAPDERTALHFRRTLEYVGRLSPERVIAVPEQFGLVGNCLRVHHGYRGATHLYLEAEFTFPGAPGGYKVMVQREIEARQRTIALAVYLQEATAQFSYQLLASAAYELHGHQTTCLSGPTPDWAAAWHGRAVTLPAVGRTSVSLPVDAFAGQLAGLWQLQEAVRLSPHQAELFLDPVAATHIGNGLGQALATTGNAPSVSVSPRVPMEETAAGAGLRIAEQAAPQRGRAYAQQAVPPMPVPVLCSTQALVVGGGTSGAVAALACAREGAETALLEMNPGLGGTETLGGVPEYWMSRKVGFVEEIQRSVQEIDRRLGFHPPSRWQQWSIEGRMHVFLRDNLVAGVRVFLYALAIGALVDGQRVRGAVAATPYGPHAVLADVTVDATGDGDIAAWAGADYVYGSQRDHHVMWYSLPQIGSPGLTLGGNFTSMCDVTNIEDYTRAILAGRRRRAGIHDHGVYVAPRETRHILGDVVLTFNDQLLHRRWPDVVNIFYSNYDIKGKSTTDWNLAGLISANLEIEFPYRALLPRGLEGIIVTGKAFSAASDAVPSIRMQPDLENLGGVAGLAAALAVRRQCSLRALPVAELQQKLVHIGVLPTSILGRRLRQRFVGEDEVAIWISRLDDNEPLYALNNMPDWVVWRRRIPFVEVCSAGPHAIPLLRSALQSATGRRCVLLAQALAMCGDAGGAAVLVESINEMLGDGPLPPRTAFILNAVNHLPDHAAMPDVVYLIYSLGMARSANALPIWQKVVDRLVFTDEDVRDPFKAPYYYVDAVCYGAERLGDPAAIPILEKLHAHPLLHHQVAHSGFQADYMLERLATLELAIGRALARCGATHGLAVLVDYLSDVRTLLAEHAHSELVSITGHDFGKDTAAWSRWLAQQPARLPAKPWLAPTDAVRAWSETILSD